MATLIEKPILSVECDEPEGKIIRHVRLMTLTRENLFNFWEHSRQFRTLFSSEVTDFSKFLSLFLQEGTHGFTTRGLFWVIDDFVGVYYMTDITASVEAKVHYSFFDRRHRGRRELTKAMLRYAFERYKFRRMTAEIPLYATHHTFRFIESLGFIREGRKRKAVFYNDDWFDMNCYGLLREDILNGNE